MFFHASFLVAAVPVSFSVEVSIHWYRKQSGLVSMCFKSIVDYLEPSLQQNQSKGRKYTISDPTCTDLSYAALQVSLIMELQKVSILYRAELASASESLEWVLQTS